MFGRSAAATVAPSVTSGQATTPKQQTSRRDVSNVAADRTDLKGIGGPRVQEVGEGRRVARTRTRLHHAGTTDYVRFALPAKDVAAGFKLHGRSFSGAGLHGMCRASSAQSLLQLRDTGQIDPLLAFLSRSQSSLRPSIRRGRRQRAVRMEDSAKSLEETARQSHLASGPHARGTKLRPSRTFLAGRAQRATVVGYMPYGPPGHTPFVMPARSGRLMRCKHRPSTCES